MRFFDAADKLGVMSVDIHNDLLAIMLLYSLPPSFENFRCAIESRDSLPSPDILKVKIIEEYETRKQDSENTDTSGHSWLNAIGRNLRSIRKLIRRLLKGVRRQ